MAFERPWNCFVCPVGDLLVVVPTVAQDEQLGLAAAHLRQHPADAGLRLLTFHLGGGIDGRCSLPLESAGSSFVVLTALACAERVESHVRRHAVQPTAQSRQIPGRACVQAVEDLQRQCLGFAGITHDGRQRPADPGPVLVEGGF